MLFGLFKKKTVQPVVVPFAQSELVSQLIMRRSLERVRKFKKLLDPQNVEVVSEILTKNQKPLEYKLTKGVRDELAEMIVVALAKKNR